MKTKKSMSAVVLFGFLVLSSCDKKNAFLVNRRTATPEKIEEAKKRKEDEERARVKAKEKADADTRRNVALRAHDAACRRCHSDFDAANRDHDVKANRVSVCDFTSSFTSFVTYRENPLTPARTTAYYAIRNPALTDYNYAIKTATDNRLDAIRTAACDDTVAAAESTFNTVTAKALADYKAALDRANAADHDELIRKQNEEVKRAREELKEKQVELRKEQENLRKKQEALSRVNRVLIAYGAQREVQEVQEAQGRIIQREGEVQEALEALGRKQEALDRISQEIAREKKILPFHPVAHIMRERPYAAIRCEWRRVSAWWDQASVAIVRAIAKMTEDAEKAQRGGVFEKALEDAQNMLQEVQEALQGVKLAAIWPMPTVLLRGRADEGLHLELLQGGVVNLTASWSMPPGGLLGESCNDPLKEARAVLQGMRAKKQKKWQEEEKWKEKLRRQEEESKEISKNVSYTTKVA